MKDHYPWVIIVILVLGVAAITATAREHRGHVRWHHANPGKECPWMRIEKIEQETR